MPLNSFFPLFFSPVLLSSVSLSQSPPPSISSIKTTNSIHLFHHHQHHQSYVIFSVILLFYFSLLLLSTNTTDDGVIEKLRRDAIDEKSFVTRLEVNGLFVDVLLEHK